MSFVDAADETAEDVVPIEGTVKWFDPVKGYGFVVPDQGGVDILVHHSTLRRGGYDMLYPMARIKCTIVERAQGLQAGRIVAIDNTNAEVPVGGPRPTDVMSEISDVSEFQQSQVKWFNRVRGFRFVNVEPDGSDIFVHMEVLRKVGIEALVPGQYVLVKFGRGPKGLMATDVKRLDSGGRLQQSGGNMFLQESDHQDVSVPVASGLAEEAETSPDPNSDS